MLAPGCGSRVPPSSRSSSTATVLSSLDGRLTLTVILSGRIVYYLFFLKNDVNICWILLMFSPSDVLSPPPTSVPSRWSMIGHEH